jgi:hypothetical protein
MQNCPICGDILSNSLKGYGVISPWIRDWGGIRKRTSVLFICNFCEGASFDYRFNADEMARIYIKYRSLEYTQIRTKWERWYTVLFNSSHDFGPIVDKRKSILESFLDESGISEIKKVVDVGGDLGQYIPNFDFDTSRYVIDVTDRQLVDGVKRIARIDDVSEIDLIIYANVLEHVANPLENLAQLISSARYVYVEVPFGIPAITVLRKSRLFQISIIILSLSPYLWRRFSIPSTGRDPRSSILRQSEHLSFFNETSIKRLAEKLNVHLILKVVTIPTPERGEGRAIQALFSKN